MLNFKNLSLLVAGTALFMQSCNNQNSGDFQTTKSGLEYRFVKKGDGTKPESGQILTLNMIYKDAKDSILFNTHDMGSPVPIQHYDSLPPGSGAIEEGFMMLKKGDSAIFRVPAKNLFEKTFRSSVPEEIDTASFITFHIGVVDVMTEEQFNAHAMEEYNKRQEASLTADTEKIDQYLKENNIEAQKTESGLRYTIIKEGNGTQPKPGDQVEVHYVGSLLSSGEVFDTSRETVAKENDIHDARNPYKPLAFVHGQGQMIPGFDEGVGHLKKGSLARLYLPSSLAYGERGAGGRIGPNSILIFEVELVDVK